MFKRYLVGILSFGLLANALLAPASALTTGSLRGRVTDAGSGAPIAGVRVTVESPSLRQSATSDAGGNFIFISLDPDTYAVRAEKNGFDPTSQPGVSVFANQSTYVNLALASTLKTIARVSARGAGSLVRAGTTSDVYSVNASGQKATQALGGSGSLDQAYSAIASVPGVSIPTGQQGWYQSVFIRGGDYDQVAYEFDGVPVIRQSDGAPIVTLSALGQQEVQVYTGGTPATSDSPGLAGYINQVIKTGTHPGYANVTAGVGAPAFYHKLSVETGGSTPDRLFSYYVGIAAANEDYRYGDQFNAVGDPLYFYPYSIPTTVSGTNLIDGSCGDPTLSTACPGPNYGAVFVPGNAWAQTNNNDREAVMNLHFGLPHHRDGGRDDVQLMWVNGSIFTTYYSSAQQLGLSSPVPYFDGTTYTGSVFAPPDPTQLAVAPFPSSPTGRAFASNIPFNQADGGSNSYGVMKVQYQKNFGSNAYLRAIGYGEYTNWFLNGPNSSQNTFGATLADYEVVGHIFGGSLIYSNALSDKHLLTASLSASTQKLQTYNAQFGTTGLGSIVTNFVGNDNRCYNFQTGQPWSCFDSTTQGGCTTGACFGGPSDPGIVLAPADCVSAGTCTNPAAANAGARWLVTENGRSAQVDNVTPNFSSAAITDIYKPNDRLTFNVGMRLDRFSYKLDNLVDGYPARAFWFSNYNNEFCGAPGQDNVSRWNPATATFDPCPAGYSPVNFTNSRGGTTTQWVFQPRLAGTYTVNPNTVLRFSYGKYARAAATSYHEYNEYDQNLPAFLAQFAPLGYTTPNHDVVADTSNNLDLSYEHHVPGTQLSFKISPFYRTTKNQLQYLSISALGGVLAGINVGTLKAYGLELSLQAGDFARDGFSGQLAYTYTNTHTRYAALPNGLNLIDVLNRQIEQYNSYTSACAANETQAICGGGLYAANAGATLASSTTPGLLVPNPYYASAPQPLMDRGAEYVPYDVVPGPFASGNSYAVPHVASLVLNYRHKKFAITPSLSYNSGSYYGSPLSWPGYVPQACSQLPSATPQTPGVSCGSGGTIFMPDPYTQRFDGLGTLREPSQLVGNLQLSYDVNPRMSVTVLASNVYNNCRQRGYAWDTRTACWYSSLPSNILAPVGNFLQTDANGIPVTGPVQLRYPYGVWFNNTQVGITSAKQPFQLTVNLDIKL